MSGSDDDASPCEKNTGSVIAIPTVIPPEIRSTVLLQGQREIIILHGGDRYRLRVTSNDKLILTK